MIGESAPVDGVAEASGKVRQDLEDCGSLLGRRSIGEWNTVAIEILADSRDERVDLGLEGGQRVLNVLDENGIEDACEVERATSMGHAAIS